MNAVKLILIAINLNIFLLGVIFLVMKKGNPLANKLKGLFLISAAYIAFSMTMLEDIVMYPFLIRVYEPVSLVVLPSLFLYFSRLIDEKRKIRLFEWFHFLPALLSFVVLAPFLIKTNIEKIQWLEESTKNYQYYKTWNVAYLIHFFIYTGFFVGAIRKFIGKTGIKENKRKVMKQVMAFIIMILCVHAVALPLMIAYIPNLFVLFIPLQIFVIYGIYRLIKSSRLMEFAYLPYEIKQIKSDKINPLIEYLNVTEDFYSPMITLDLVSKKTGVALHDISRYINENLGINFNDFVNNKRIEEACKRLHNAEFQHLSYEGIGQSVGFSSKSTFYRSFKKFTGKTPGEYMNDYKEASKRPKIVTEIKQKRPVFPKKGYKVHVE